MHRARLFNSASEVTMKEISAGINVEAKTGHLFYADDFKAMELNFDLIFIRHGETYGNCGKITKEGKIDLTLEKNKDNRIFQGNVDTPINRLTPIGMQQAEEAALKLKFDYLDKGWMPDIILTSPLKRARDTAEPFVSCYGLEDILYQFDDIREMSFGAWDNRRVSDFADDDICHSFYREQNALIKQSGENNTNHYSEAESFCDVLLRAKKTIDILNRNYAGAKIVMFSHSMFGAALSIILGKGQKVENGNYLAFDGKRADGTSYTMEHATPIYFAANNNIATSKLKKTF